MKKSALSLIIAALLFSAGAFAQNPSRKTLYILGSGEKIHYNEYIMSMTLDGYMFAAIIENTRTHEFRFVFNGKTIAKGDGKKYSEESSEYNSPINVFYLDPEQKDGYGYDLEIAGRTFTRLGDKILPDVDGEVWSFMVRPNGKFALRYFKKREWYANIDGKNFGPYNRVYDIVVTDNGRFALYYTKDAKDYVTIDGKILGPYKDVDDVAVTDNGRFAFGYKEEDDICYANIDGKIFGPYKDVDDVAVTDNGRFAFDYREEDDRYYANIDGKIFGPYKDVGNVTVADNGRFAFGYKEEDDRCYANIDGKILGPYKDVDDVAIADNGRFAFSGWGDDDHYYYSVDGNKVSVMDYYAAVAEIKGERPQKHFINDYDPTEIISPDGKHIFYSNPEYSYVVIDGDKTGKHPAINAYYDKQKNAFIWNTIEERELVVYEYKL
ncbi:MAG: hypothetical protein LBK65_08365 [Tannerellaceae bacterium]|jgi:hypothetical protein|nr:hypothetical protein [Tannerellaceae bacterium]